MNKDEAQKIASAVNHLRPDWSANGVMSILADDRMRNRPMTDVAVAFVALACDANSRKPTRIYEHGHWWEILAPRIGSTVEYRTVSDDDCAICGKVAGLHSRLGNDPHEWEPQHARGQGVGPTPEQRAAIDKAAAEASLAMTAAKEAQAAKEPRDPDAVVRSHLDAEGAA